MRVLVTGGAGFIGSALVRYLVSEIGADVINIDKLTYAGNLASLKAIEKAPNYRGIKADSGDRSAVSRACEEWRPD
ncbi:NAD-dependent epimerase/dehydratase family protein, partial [Rhizobium ruizarguesonis]